MRQTTIIVFLVLMGLTTEGFSQQYFSRSLDLAKSGNHIIEVVANEEEILLSNLINCPVPGPLTSCGGFHIYNHLQDSLMGEYYLSTYPKPIYPCFDPIEFGVDGEVYYCVTDVVQHLDLTATVLSVNRDGEFDEIFRFLDCLGTLCSPRGITIPEEGGYLMYGEQWDTTIVQGGGSYFLLKLDEKFNVEWYNYYEISSWQVTHLRSMTLLPNGNIVLIGFIGGFTNRILTIVVTDSSGNELWRRIINTDPGWNYGMGLPFVSPLGEDQLLVSWVRYRTPNHDMGIWGGYFPYFYIFDEDGNEVKTTLLDQAVDFRNVNRVKPTADGGIVGVGDFNERPKLSGEIEYRGYMFRLDNRGDLMWEKTYWDISHISEDFSHASNYFMDVAELPDGRIVAGGGRKDTVGPGVQNSNGWLVMLDENGDCPSVEGCEHLEIRDLTITSTNDIEEDLSMPVLEVFPNPASHEVFIRVPEFTSGSIQVYNMHGQLVHYEPSVRLQRQIEVSHWPQGMYIVHFRSSDGRMLLKEKMVVMRQ